MKDKELRLIVDKLSDQVKHIDRVYIHECPKCGFDTSHKYVPFSLYASLYQPCDVFTCLTCGTENKLVAHQSTYEIVNKEK